MSRLHILLACAFVLALYALGAVFDGPSETDALQASALDLQDAIADARIATAPYFNR
jgi:hypothetical protein